MQQTEDGGDEYAGKLPNNPSHSPSLQVLKERPNDWKAMLNLAIFLNEFTAVMKIVLVTALSLGRTNITKKTKDQTRTAERRGGTNTHQLHSLSLQVLKERPNDWKAMLNLAVALIGLGSTAEAQTVLVAALRLEERIEIHDTIEHLKRLARKGKSPSAALGDLEQTGLAEPSTTGAPESGAGSCTESFLYCSYEDVQVCAMDGPSASA
jgi:hypothetical protein